MLDSNLPADPSARLRAIGRDLVHMRGEMAHFSLQQESGRDRLCERLEQLAQWQQRLRQQVPALVRPLPPLPTPPDLQSLTVLRDADTLQRHDDQLARWLLRFTDEPGQSLPMASLISRYPLLKLVARERLLLRVVAEMTERADEHANLVAAVWEGLPGPAPACFDAVTVSSLPAALRPELENRWADLCVKRWCQLNYGSLVADLFASRQPLLDAVIFRQIVLVDLAAAQELALQLDDDPTVFGELARSHSLDASAALGGLVGPIPLGEVSPSLRHVLQSMRAASAMGPLEVDGGVVLLRLEAHLPAQLDDKMEAALLETMLEEDLEAVLQGEAPPHAWSLGSIESRAAAAAFPRRSLR